MTFERLLESTEYNDRYILFPSEPVPETSSEPKTPQIIGLVAKASDERVDAEQFARAFVQDWYHKH